MPTQLWWPNFLWHRTQSGPLSVIIIPTCQVRVARFCQSHLLLRLLLLLFLLLLLLLLAISASWPILLANPVRQASRQSCSPSFSPILFAKLLANPLRQLRIAVSTAGPQPQGSDRSEHRWTSTASVRAQWSDRSEGRWTSTAK